MYSVHNTRNHMKKKKTIIGVHIIFCILNERSVGLKILCIFNYIISGNNFSDRRSRVEVLA